jgi:hypothetical protein
MEVDLLNSPIILICNSQRFAIGRIVIIGRCSRFVDDQRVWRSLDYQVRSPVAPDVFSDFCRALEDKEIDINEANSDGLLLLSVEFGFGSLHSRLLSLQQTPVKANVIEQPSSSSAESVRHEHNSNVHLRSHFCSLKWILYTFLCFLVFCCSLCVFSHNNMRRVTSESTDQNLVEAAKRYRTLANRGDPESQLRYGHCLSRGEGVERNDSEAAKYYKLSADQGHSEGQFYYADCLLTGKGVEKNIAVAVSYLKNSADHGNSRAQFRYGICLVNGEGVDKNAVEAAEYFKLSADQGDSASQTNYGVCLWKGQDVDKNDVEAAKYFKMPADQGNSYGQLSYALCLERARRY